MLSRIQRSRCGRLGFRALSLLPLAGGLSTAALAQQAAPAAGKSAPATIVLSPAVQAGAPSLLEQLSNELANVASRVRPSVVFITAKETGPELASMDTAAAVDSVGEAIASGSGLVVSPDGYILTNDHVIDGTKDVTVRLLDRREFSARLVGRDAATDIAVLKIDATDLTPALLGNSEAVRVGEWALAVGNPLNENLTFTVTQGIISAKGRGRLKLPGSSTRSIQDFIQTDAAINPGSSGGPLVNVRGEVIGINSAFESPTGYNAGYAFAVPINLARAVMDQLIKNGRVERVALGVTVHDATAADVSRVGLMKIGGVAVENYDSPSSPAKRAGLKPGDVIVAVNGKPVEYVAQLQEAIAFRKPGEIAAVDVVRRRGKRATVNVRLQREIEERTERTAQR